MSLKLKLNLTMKKIEIEIPNGKRAEWINGVLTLVDDTPKDVTERIKTFEDACEELGNEHPFVSSYKGYANCISEENKKDVDIIAYLKLRIIVTALNEGWTPKFTKDERRWYPWFKLWTGKELSMIGKAGWKDDRHLIMIGDKYQSEYAGLAFTHSVYAPSSTYMFFGSRLCLKSEALATYCGKQFINLWADFVLIKK